MFTEEQRENLEKASKVLKTIANPMRLAIIWLLKDGKELSVSEIHGFLNKDQGLTSHYLTKLKDQGVLDSRRVGKNCLYFIKNEEILNIFKCMKI